MNDKKKLALLWLLIILLAVAAVGLVWYLFHYILIDFRSYPKSAQVLDLRGEEITVEHYETLHARLPDCVIYWDVPFQDTVYSNDITELTLTTLTEEDVERMDYFTSLQVVQAEQCTDYAQLLALQQRRPELEINYTLTLSGQSFSRSASSITVSSIAQEEIALLACLPQLETVVVTGGDTENFAQLQEYCHENGLAFCIAVNEQTIADDAEQVTVSAITDAELNLLPLLTDMEALHMVDPQASAENVILLRQTYPDAAITWERDVCGVTVTTEDVDIDLSETEIASLDEVEQAMAYFPDAETVFLGDCGLENEDIAAYRERVREDYKVVWIVYCGEKLPTRTDATSFMPSRDGVGYFKDSESYNLRYCEDMIAIDVGHMGVKDISFVAYMPNLTYLILAHTEVQDITPISNCKNLIFLELDWSPIQDYTPLQGCTALEDLNIGMYGADVTPICEMTWLKNVWCIFRPASAAKLAQALPDTKVMASGNATVASGWRNLPNYYAMRDALGMYYMSW